MTEYNRSRRRWANSSEERRLRCQVTEQRGNGLKQCSEDRRYPHVHQWRGTPFEQAA